MAAGEVASRLQASCCFFSSESSEMILALKEKILMKWCSANLYSSWPHPFLRAAAQAWTNQALKFRVNRSIPIASLDTTFETQLQQLYKNSVSWLLVPLYFFTWHHRTKSTIFSQASKPKQSSGSWISLKWKAWSTLKIPSTWSSWMRLAVRNFQKRNYLSLT